MIRYNKKALKIVHSHSSASSIWAQSDRENITQFNEADEEDLSIRKQFNRNLFKLRSKWKFMTVGDLDYSESGDNLPRRARANEQDNFTLQRPEHPRNSSLQMSML